MRATTLKFSGKRLTKARLRSGWTQADLARALVTTERNISRWENEESTPRGETVAEIAQKLGREIVFFYVARGDSEDEDDEEAAQVGSASASLETALRAIVRDENQRSARREVEA